ncbi:MAG: DUF5103 domain-containing protein [Bacteroidales bacterium]|nr:DUF5103 domain-containing protein [Bacteroidales bacterium]
MTKKLAIFLFLIFISFNISAQNAIKEYIGKDIKTVEFRKTETNFGLPICYLSESLTLSFDIINDNYSDLSYTIQHCDADFVPDDLDFYEFADGFDNRTADDFSSSFNTHSKFTHYKINIPNNDITLNISGNYIIKVYETSNPDNIILIKKFMICDNETQLMVDAEIERPFLAEYSIDCQQININIDNSKERISNPTKFMKVYVQQNGNINSRCELNHNYADTYNIRYNNNEGNNIFKGGCEYEFFDAKDKNFRSLGIDKIEFKNNLYSFDLTTYYPSYNSYSYKEDLNGQYYIKNDRGFDNELEADYINVNFKLKYDAFADGKIYVFGQLSNYELNEENLLQFNSETNLYECNMLLKQGLYNFTFINQHSDNSIEYLDGSWYNTENSYLITIYNTNYSYRGNRLIGYKIINSMNK